MSFELAPLGSLAKFINGDRGENYPKPTDYVEKGIPFLTATDVGDGKVAWSQSKKISSESYTKLRSGQIQRDDILFCLRGSLGKFGYVENDSKGAIASSLVILRADSTNTARYLRFVLGSAEIQAEIKSLDNGSVQGNISAAALKTLMVPNPPEGIRTSITAVLESLDGKIDLSRKINENLEAMAQAILKSWFVDFDPVKAKIAAKTAGQDPLRAAMTAISGKPDAALDALPPEQYTQLAATAALFPDEMEESALGDIPKGWAVQRVGDLLELVYGKALKSTDRAVGDIPVYGSGGITGFHNEALVPTGSIVVGRKGTVGSLYWEDGPFFPIDTTFYVRTIDAPLTFCFYLMQTLGLEKMNTDAAVPGLNRENVYRLEVIRPETQLLKLFDTQVSTLRKTIHENTESSKSLANLRDVMLPKLLSGQLLVQENIEEAEA